MLQLIEAHDGPVLVEAGRGSGKSFLANQLGASKNRVVIDDAGPEDAAAIGPNTVLLSSAPLDVDLRRFQWQRLTDADLWFDVEEIESLLLAELGEHPTNPAIAAALEVHTEGWPAAVAAVIGVLGHRGRLRRQIERTATAGPHLTPIVDEVLSDLPEAFRAELAQVASMSLVLPEFFDRFDSCDGWVEARRFGLPIKVEPDGSLVLPEPLRLHLVREGGEPSFEKAHRWGLDLAAAYGLEDALDTLIGIESWAAAQAVLLGSSEGSRYDTDQVRMLHRLTHLVSKTEPEPETLITIAVLLLKLARLDELGPVVDQAVTLAEERDQPALALRAEILRLLGVSRRAPAAVTEEALSALATRQADVGDDVTELELQRLRFLHLAGHQEPYRLTEAVKVGEEAAQRYLARGEAVAAADLLRQVALGPLLDLGHYYEIGVLDERANDIEGRTIPSQRSLVFNAVAMSLAGDIQAHQKAVERLETLYGQVSIDWLEAYLWGARMIVASLLGDVAGTSHCFRKYNEKIGSLALTPSGRVWDAFAASAFALVGDTEQAMAALQRISSSQHELSPGSTLAELVVAARVGDPAVAIELHRRFSDEGMIPPGLRWRADLERLVAERRAGIPPSKKRRVVEEAAARVGLLQLAQRLWAPRQHDSDDRVAQIRVCLFGRFTIRKDGELLEPKHGKPSDLIKVLLVRGGSAHVEVVIDALWPGSDVGSARRRLRNVLARARELLEKDMLVRTGEVLALAPTVASDLADYRRSLASAASAPVGSPAHLTAVRETLGIARHELLAADLYADWAAEERRQVEFTVGRFVDELLATDLGESDARWLRGLIADLANAYPGLRHLLDVVG